MNKFFIALLLLFSVSFSLLSTAVSAQEESFVQTEVATQEAVLIKQRETQRIAQLRILYRDQVEVYRNSEKAFSIAKTNYQQVQTLSALEEAIKATKTVMTDRSRVMITYLELIDAVLIETNGIELDLKNQSHTELFGLINALKIHQDDISLSSDRQSMVLLADQFEPISFSYQSSVYKALSLIRIGKIQEVRDKSEIIFKDVITEHSLQDESSVVGARRQRAYSEIERNFDEINAELTELNDTFLQARRDGFTRSFYGRILTSLSPVYAQISRSLDHIEELIRL